MTYSLEGKVAVVTGGSRGIGREICLKLAELKSDLLINNFRDDEELQDTLNQCRAKGVKAEPMIFDVSNSEAIDLAFTEAKKEFGKIDILVNNAGISIDGLFVRMNDEDWYKTLAVNLSGSVFCARAASKIMMKARSGRIINIASVVGQMGNAGQVPYVSSKAGIIGFTKAIARELASRNITVNAIAPGFIETAMTQALDEKVREEHKKGIPLGRYGQPEEVASLVAFLASDEAGYITGQTIALNGGMYM